MQKDIEEIKIDIAEIKVDLKYHIARTNKLEEMILPIYKFKVWLKYNMVIIGAIATIAGAISAILSLRGLL